MYGIVIWQNDFLALPLSLFLYLTKHIPSYIRYIDRINRTNLPLSTILLLSDVVIRIFDFPHSGLLSKIFWYLKI